MKATFRCKRSGNTVSFINADDIAGLRKHEGYEELTDTVPLVLKEEPALPEFLMPAKVTPADPKEPEYNYPEVVDLPRRGRKRKVG